MSSENVGKLYEAVKADNPNDAADIARRYEEVLASRNEEAKGRLGDLAATIIEAPKDAAYADTRKGMIDQFSFELDLVGDSPEVSENAGFERARELASALKLPFSVDGYGLAYRSLPEGLQIEPEKIEATFGALLKLAKSGDKVKAYMYGQATEIGRLMGQYANGAFFEAEKTAQDLVSKVENVQRLDSFIGKIGFGAIGLEEAELMRATFADNGVKLDDATKIILREKRANKEFGALRMSPTNLAQLLVKVVLDSKSGDKSALVEVHINAMIGAKNTELVKGLNTARAEIAKLNKSLVDYKAKNPDVKIDAEIARLSLALAEKGKEMHGIEMNVAINGARYELAMAVFTRDGGKVDKKLLDDILKSETTDQLRILGRAQKFADSTYLAKADAAEIDSNFAQMSMDESAWIKGNPGVLSNYNKLLNAGKMGKVDKGVINGRVDTQRSQLESIKSTIASRIATEYKYFRSLGFTRLSQVSEEMRPYVASRLEGFTQLLAKNRDVCGKLLGLNADYKLANGKDFFIGEELKTLRETDSDTVDQIKEVVYFIGGDEAMKEFHADDVGVLAISPMQESVLALETEKFDSTFEISLHNAAQAYAKADDVPKMFERFNHYPDSKEAKDGKLIHVFEDGVRIYNNLADQVSGARKNLITLRAAMVAQMNDSKATPENTELASARKLMFERAIEKVDMVLYAPGSPLYADAVKSVIETRDKFAAEYKNWLEKEGYKIVAMAIVIATAVMGAMAVGALARAGAGKLFGTLHAAGRISSSVATFGTGTASLSGAAAGATVSQRLGMYATDAMKISEFAKGGAISWDAGDLGADFVLNFGMSAAAVLAAKGLGLGIRIGSSSATRFPRFAAASVRVGKGLEAVKRFTSPLEGVGKSVSRNVSTVLGKVGIRVGSEVGQEYVESGVEAVNPWAGFLVSVLNATDGMDVSLNHAASKLEGLGIKVQNGKLTNNFSTAAELTAALNGKFPKSGGYSVEVKAGENGGSWVSIIGEGGQIDLDFFVEKGTDGVAAIKGVEMVNGAPVVKAAKNMMSVLDGLTKQGYTVSMSEQGIVAKNLATGEEVTIQVSPDVKTEFAVELEKHMVPVIKAATELSSAIEEDGKASTFESRSRLRWALAGFLSVMTPGLAQANVFDDAWDYVTGKANDAYDATTGAGIDAANLAIEGWNIALFSFDAAVFSVFLITLVLGKIEGWDRIPNAFKGDFGVFGRLSTQFKSGKVVKQFKDSVDRLSAESMTRPRLIPELESVNKVLKNNLKFTGTLLDKAASDHVKSLSQRIDELIVLAAGTDQNAINAKIAEINSLIRMINNDPKLNLARSVPIIIFSVYWLIRLLGPLGYADYIVKDLPKSTIGTIDVMTDDDAKKSRGGASKPVDPVYLPKRTEEPNVRPKRQNQPQNDVVPEAPKKSGRPDIRKKYPSIKEN